MAPKAHARAALFLACLLTAGAPVRAGAQAVLDTSGAVTAAVAGTSGMVAASTPAPKARQKRTRTPVPTATPEARVAVTSTSAQVELEPEPLAVTTGGGAVAALTSALGTALSQPLPPVTPEPAIAPVIEGTKVKRVVLAPDQRPEAVIWTIIGLLGVAALAWISSDKRVVRLEETLGIAQVITTGFPFVVLGMLARSSSVGFMSDQLLAELSPLLRLGLGWIGVIVGFRFDANLLGGLPRGTARTVAMATSLPFGFVLASAGLLLLFTTGIGEESLRDPVFVRDALILGTAAAMTAVTATRAAGAAAETVQRLVRIEEIAGIVGLGLVAAYFRPQGTSWQMPGTAWLFLTIGLGVTLGALIHAILQRAKTDAEFTALMLGCVSLAAGIAGYLHLSSVVVAFLAGAMLANLPGSPKDRLAVALFRLERPIYLASLFVIGALWNASDWRGWVLMPLFAVARLAGKWVAFQVATTASPPLTNEARNALVFSPIGPLAIAIVVNAELLYPGGSISHIVSGVIGGAVLTELILQVRARHAARVALRATGGAT